MLHVFFSNLLAVFPKVDTRAKEALPQDFASADCVNLVGKIDTRLNIVVKCLTRRRGRLVSQNKIENAHDEISLKRNAVCGRSDGKSDRGADCCCVNFFSFLFSQFLPDDHRSVRHACVKLTSAAVYEQSESQACNAEARNGNGKN